MARIIRSEKIKKEVERARKQGKTYRELTATFGIPKSTLSYWFGDKLDHPYDREGQLKHLANIRPLAILAKKKISIQEQSQLKSKIQAEIKSYPVNNTGLQKLFLAGLYWAEGSKHKKVGGLRFANTDPKLSLLYLSLLRKCYSIDESRLRVRLHLHYYHKIRDTKLFWSKLLSVPLNQFGKIYIKNRSKTKKFRKNFSGICFIYYFDGNVRKELLELTSQFHDFVTSS